MNWLVHAMIGDEPTAVELAEPALETRTRRSEGDPANDWLCAWCFHRVASEKDRFVQGGKSEFSFKNPEGVRFHIITFAQTLGCRDVGASSLEHTWFPGYAWSFCLCGRCRMHLGWYYAGPNRFAGLIRDRIVRASVVMN